MPASTMRRAISPRCSGCNWGALLTRPSSAAGGLQARQFVTCKGEPGCLVGQYQRIFPVVERRTRRRRREAKAGKHGRRRRFRLHVALDQFDCVVHYPAQHRFVAVAGIHAVVVEGEDHVVMPLQAATYARRVAVEQQAGRGHNVGAALRR